MCDGFPKEQDYVEELFADRSFIARNNSLSRVNTEHSHDEETAPSRSPSSIVYPKANLYYAFAEDTHPTTRIAAVSKLFEEGASAPRHECSVDLDPYSEDRVVDRYLKTDPPSFVIFGKPGLNSAHAASALADAWNCVLISPASLIRREIDADTEEGRYMERNLRLGEYVGAEIVATLMRRRIGMRDIKHRGYVLEGLPLLPNDASFDYSSYSTRVSDLGAEFCENATDENDERPRENRRVTPCVRGGSSEASSSRKARIDHETEIPRQIDEIFTVWPLKPLIIIYMVCPRQDIASRRARRRFETTTGDIVFENERNARSLDDVTTAGYDDDSDASLGLGRITNQPPTIVPDERRSYLLRRISDVGRDVEAQCALYERLALPVIDKWILAHNPQRVVRVDGRSSARRILGILETRLRVLPLLPTILPKRMIERDDALDFPEAPSEMSTSDDDELAGKSSAEEAFEVLSRRETVSPRFPWRLSAWRFRCPVELALGRTVEGLPRYSVRFLSKIFFLSSRRAADLFVENPRTFLQSPNPRPACKIAVFGPKCAGKSALSARLAEAFGGTAINVDRIAKESVEKASDVTRETVLDTNSSSRDLRAKESTIRRSRENDFDERIKPERAKRDESDDMSIDEKADIIIQSIKEIPDERLEDELRRDGGYVVDGMYTDIEVWRRVVYDANIAFEDIVVLFENEPYVNLLDKFRDISRPADCYAYYEGEYDTDRMEYEETSREEWEYLEHLKRFNLEWAEFEEQLSEFSGNVIRCNLADVRDAAEHAINDIKRRFGGAAGARAVAEERAEETEIFRETTVDTTDDETGSIRDRVVERAECTVDLETAERLLEHGYYFLSSFGRWCPVRVYSGQTPIQMFPPMRARGQIFPVVRDCYVYFLAGAEMLSAFLNDPTRYLAARQSRLPPLPLRISVIGPPKCGKTTLARRFAETYGMRVITRGEALRHALRRYDWTELARATEDRLRAGDAAPIEFAVVRAVEMLSLGSRATSQGYILDGCPSDREEAELLALLGIQPMIVLDLKANLRFCLECLSRNDDDYARRPPNFSAGFLTRRYASWRERQASFRDWLSKFSRNVVELDAVRSKWYVWTRADRAVRSRFADIALYFRDADLDKVHSLRCMCVSFFEFRSRWSRYESYCPVCLCRENVLKTFDQLTDSRGMVQFREHFYWICPRHMDAFARDPLRYLPPVNTASLPDEPPRILDEAVDVEHACLAQRLRFDGLCPVTYVDGLPRRELTQGRADLAVLFNGRVYLLCSERCREKFLARPVKYSGTDIALPPIEPPPIEASRLPDLDFLKQTVAKAIVEAVNLVAARRPKIFGLSASVSAAIYIGVHLKTRHASASLDEADVYAAASKRMAERDKIIRTITDIMKKKLNPHVSLPKYSVS